MTQISVNILLLMIIGSMLSGVLTEGDVWRRIVLFEGNIGDSDYVFDIVNQKQKAEEISYRGSFSLELFNNGSFAFIMPQDN